MDQAINENAIDRPQMHASHKAAIEISGMHEWYGNFHVLRDTNSIYEGL